MTQTTDVRMSPSEAFEEGVQKLSDAGHEAALTVAGLAVMGARGAYRAWSRREEILEAAQQEGVALESDLLAQLQFAEERAKERVKSKRRKVQSFGRQIRSPFSLLNKTAHKLRNQIDAQLDGNCTVCRTPEAQEIKITVEDNLDLGNIEPENVTPGAELVEPPCNIGSVELPLASYDDLTAKEIVAALPTLSLAQCSVLREYESKRRGRVTILRAIDRLLGS